MNYMLSASRDVRRIRPHITAYNYTFAIVQELIYLGSAVTSKNDVSIGSSAINRLISSGELAHATN